MTGTPGGKDFAKLVLGSARNRLFVGRRFAHIHQRKCPACQRGAPGLAIATAGEHWP